MTGIIAFSGSVSVLALAMTPLASTGTEGAIAMAAFGVVVAGLVAIFATFGTALNAAIPAMLAFGATILMVGEGMNLASSFIDALVPLIQQLGDTFQTVGETIGDVAESIGEAIKTVGEAGFYGNKKVVSVKLQDGVENIDAFAFKDCTQLQAIEIPDSVQNIDSSAFDGCENLTIYGSENSKAEEAAEKLDISFDTGEPEFGEDQDAPEGKKKESDNAAQGLNNTGKIIQTL